MVNLRLSDDEVEILDYAVGVDLYGRSRKILLMDLLKDYVSDNILKIPAVANLDDSEILIFIERNKIQRYEDIRSFSSDEQFKHIIEESHMFEDLADYEKQKKRLLGTGGEVNE